MGCVNRTTKGLLILIAVGLFVKDGFLYHLTNLQVEEVKSSSKPTGDQGLDDLLAFLKACANWMAQSAQKFQHNLGFLFYFFMDFFFLWAIVFSLYLKTNMLGDRDSIKCFVNVLSFLFFNHVFHVIFLNTFTYIWIFIAFDASFALIYACIFVLLNSIVEDNQVQKLGWKLWLEKVARRAEKKRQYTVKV